MNILRPITLLALLVNLNICTGCDNQRVVGIGDEPPEISGNDIHNEQISLKRLKGKVVVLYFWCNSCCAEKLKLLEPLYRQNKNRGLALLAINIGDGKDVVESYVKSFGLTFTMMTDEREMIAREYGVFGLPTTFILDGQGIVRQKVLGAISAEQLQKLVEW
jgi:peroxiredoxin